jgi:TRAP-type uncharacterized transport system substrate-binding protein
MPDALPFRPGSAPDIRTYTLAQMAIAMQSNRSTPGRPFRELRLSLGSSGPDAFISKLTFASDMPDVAEAVARGEVDLGTLNPSAYLTMACRGVGPYATPLPLRAIGVMPSLDAIVFAVAERSGLASLADIVQQHYPLRVSVRGQASHGTRFVIDRVLKVFGFSLAEIEKWGGSVHLADAPRDPERVAGIRDGSLDAVFDEGIGGWGPIALEAGMRFIPVSAEAERALAELGWRSMNVTPALVPGLRQDVRCVSFSGWPLFTRADVPDEIGYQLAQALDTARPFVPWDSDEPVALRDLCGTTDAAPLDVPLHPGAVRYFSQQGAL